MSKRSFTADEIAAILLGANELFLEGMRPTEVATILNVQLATLTEWRMKYGARPSPGSVERIRRLEGENFRLRKALARLDERRL